MPLTNTIIHPRLFEQLGTIYWRHAVTIYDRPERLNSTGEQPPDGWEPMVGHTAISCNLASDPSLMQVAAERRTNEQTYTAKLLHCMLNGHYPLIAERMRAEIDGVVYDIKGVVHVSGRNQTKLMLEVIT